MRTILLLLMLAVYVLYESAGVAQPPPPRRGERRERSTPEPAALVARMLRLDANGDGELSKSEVTDERLQSLFERADADKNGVLTRDEMTVFFTKEVAALKSVKREGPPGGPGGFGPPPGGERPNGPGGSRPRRPGPPPE